MGTPLGNAMSLTGFCGVRAWGAGLLVLAILLASATAGARAQDRDQTMSPRIGEPILAAQACQAAEDFACVVDTLTPLLSQDPTAFEQFVIHRMRGSAYFAVDRTDAAISDFNAALETGAGSPDERIALRLNVGQLLIVSEQYEAGIRAIEQALEDGAPLPVELAMMMAQAHAQIERYSDGFSYVELAFEQAAPRERRHYEFMLFYLQRLDRVAEQRVLIEAMVERWPDERSFWASLIALMAQEGDESGAFEANKLMYLNGLFAEEREIIRLAQYYSYFEYPFRGGVLLEREMNAGRVRRNAGSLGALANLWRQAREFERAIPVLEEIAVQSNAGSDYLKLAEALYQVDNLGDAERAFEQALERGGFARPGDAWALLGTVRYERSDRDGALAAFNRCTDRPESRATCRGWRDFIVREAQAASDHADMVVTLTIEECRLTLEGAMSIRTLTATESDIEDNRLTIDVPDRCVPYFNRFAEQIAGPGFDAADG